uniref:Uncharacterized protein n=1 Tax=Streptomyces sp. W75 TaxID=1170711 RepID=I0CEE1_9ACTN|nr:hypothetical protein pCQ4.29 [Streptomyces sp. W75]
MNCQNVQQANSLSCLLRGDLKPRKLKVRTYASDHPDYLPIKLRNEGRREPVRSRWLL